ncbi:MAG: DUF3099 domain-containing protein [Actinomycetota bacterium]|nr:DUF3099 domain-containing protein [Actinomycetota bacterium]
MDSKPIRREQQVFSITSASTSQSEEINRRQKRYAISMAIRTVCFLLAVVFWGQVLWLAVVFIVAALLLPYTSVVLANAGVRRKGAGSETITQEPYGELPPGEKND